MATPGKGERQNGSLNGSNPRMRSPEGGMMAGKPSTPELLEPLTPIRKPTTPEPLDPLRPLSRGGKPTTPEPLRPLSRGGKSTTPEPLNKTPVLGAPPSPSAEAGDKQLPPLSPQMGAIPPPRPHKPLKPLEPSPWQRRPGNSKQAVTPNATAEEQVFPPLGPKSVSSSPVRYNFAQPGSGRHLLDPITPPARAALGPNTAAHVFGDSQHPSPNRPTLSPVTQPPSRPVPPYTRYRVDLPAPKLASIAARPLRLEEIDSPENVLSKLARHKNRNLAIRTDSPSLGLMEKSPLPDTTPPAERPSPLPAQAAESPMPLSARPPLSVRSPKNADRIVGALDAVGLQEFVPSQQLVEKWAVLLKEQECDSEQVDQWMKQFEVGLANKTLADDEASIKSSTMSSVPESILSSGQDFTDSGTLSSLSREELSIELARINAEPKRSAITADPSSENKEEGEAESQGNPEAQHNAEEPGEKETKKKAALPWLSQLAPDRLPSPPLIPSYSEFEIEEKLREFEGVPSDDGLGALPELGDDDGEGEMLSLVYDPTLQCYYERSTGRYFKLKGGTDAEEFHSIDRIDRQDIPVS